MSRPLWAALLLKGALPMLATRTSNLRAAPKATVAELQDVLVDRAHGYHDITSRAWQRHSRVHSLRELRRPASLRSRTWHDRSAGPSRVRPASAGTQCAAQPTSAQQTLALNQIAAKLGMLRPEPAQLPLGATGREHPPLAERGWHLLVLATLRWR